LDFVAFPVRIGGNGWLVRSRKPEESVVELLRIMVSTPQQGWRGVAGFGMRDTLAALRSQPGTQLAVIKQMNQTLADLGIDWVRVETIQPEQGADPYSRAYIFTLSFPDKSTETHRIEIDPSHKEGHKAR
jgi:hypothetical protein